MTSAACHITELPPEWAAERAELLARIAQLEHQQPALPAGPNRGGLEGDAPRSASSHDALERRAGVSGNLDDPAVQRPLPG